MKRRACSIVSLILFGLFSTQLISCGSSGGGGGGGGGGNPTTSIAIKGAVMVPGGVLAKYEHRSFVKSVFAFFNPKPTPLFAASGSTGLAPLTNAPIYVITTDDISKLPTLITSTKTGSSGQYSVILPQGNYPGPILVQTTNSGHLDFVGTSGTLSTVVDNIIHQADLDPFSDYQTKEFFNSRNNCKTSEVASNAAAFSVKAFRSFLKIDSSFIGLDIASTQLNIQNRAGQLSKTLLKSVCSPDTPPISLTDQAGTYNGISTYYSGSYLGMTHSQAGTGNLTIKPMGTDWFTRTGSITMTNLDYAPSCGTGSPCVGSWSSNRYKEITAVFEYGVSSGNLTNFLVSSDTGEAYWTQSKRKDLSIGLAPRYSAKTNRFYPSWETWGIPLSTGSTIQSGSFNTYEVGLNFKNDFKATNAGGISGADWNLSASYKKFGTAGFASGYNFNYTNSGLEYQTIYSCDQFGKNCMPAWTQNPIASTSTPITFNIGSNNFLNGSLSGIQYTAFLASDQSKGYVFTDGSLQTWPNQLMGFFGMSRPNLATTSTLKGSYQLLGDGKNKNGYYDGAATINFDGNGHFTIDGVNGQATDDFCPGCSNPSAPLPQINSFSDQGTYTVNPDGSFTLTGTTFTAHGYFYNDTDFIGQVWDEIEIYSDKDNSAPDMYFYYDGELPTKPVSLSLLFQNSTITGYTTLQLKAQVNWNDGNSVSVLGSALPTWSSSDPEIAIVDSNGVVTSKANGTAQITAAYRGQSSTMTVTVTGTKSILKSITIDFPANFTSLPKGYSVQAKVTAHYSDGTIAEVTSGSQISSGNNSIAAINSSGMASGINTGSTTLYATYQNKSATTPLSVTNSTSATLVSILVSPQTLTVAAGLRPIFTATGFYSDGTTTDLSSLVTWTSSNTSAATIGSLGVATTVAPGSTTITASFQNVSGTAALNVTAASLTSIVVTPLNPNISVNQTQLFTATGKYSDGSSQDLSSQANWSSGSPSVASVSPAGMASGLASGTSLITAKFGAISGSTTLTVKGALPPPTGFCSNCSTTFNIPGIGTFNNVTMSFNGTNTVTLSNFGTVGTITLSGDAISVMTPGAVVIVGKGYIMTLFNDGSLQLNLIVAPFSTYSGTWTSP